MRHRRGGFYARLLGGAAAICLVTGTAALAQEQTSFNIPAQSLSSALNAFGEQSRMAVLFTPELTSQKIAPALIETAKPEIALAQMLAGTGLTYRRSGDTFIIQQGEGGSPQGGRAAGGGATVEALIVTAQKREENIQDVPIAISAFSQKELEAQKIEGGFDLLKAIPNVTFSKNNFTGYNFSIRGVGTKAISATTDPGVAVAFNNTTLIQNRLFEQEYFDVERVEVLRGPQGTLYGRNATSGVINVISAKPDLNTFEASIKGEIGNYDAKRAVGMINIPVLEDRLAVRLAGSWTQRSGYDYNSVTKNNVNGRDLWSTRLTVGFEPTHWLRGNVIWEHFEEDDDRSRTGKQLCHRDPGKSKIGDTELAEPDDAYYRGASDPYRFSIFSQGCLPGSLYDDGAFDTPNGLATPFIPGVVIVGLLVQPHISNSYEDTTILKFGDPYGGLMQSRDLRTIASVRDPVYRAKADIFELNLDFDLTESLTVSSQTAYNEDEVYSFQDYNRFNTLPVFNDTSLWGAPDDPLPQSFDYSLLAPGGVFCDPQIGCSDTIAGFDISQAESTQFSQEIRLASDFDGPVNFSVGANYTKFEVLADYYVMFNILTAITALPVFNYSYPSDPVDPANRHFPCWFVGANGAFIPPSAPVEYDDPLAGCPYIDPNPIDTSENFDGDGHNYFRSKNPYDLESWAGFGEMYWNINDALKLTAGLRYTKDKKNFIPVPTQALLSRGLAGGGTVNRGYPEDDPIKQEWGEWTGRLGLDWKPELDFTDQSLLYAFYSRGYKGGGANPPSPGFADEDEAIQIAIEMELPQFQLNSYINNGLFPILKLSGKDYEDTFAPEFVDAFELGSKNTLLNGALTFNTTAFYYDYKDYQVSQIRDRTAVNENFDAEIWGLEFETTFVPSRNFRMVANFGYLDTKIGDGEQSIDLMDRTQGILDEDGNPEYTLVKPWIQYPSNCIVPTHVVEAWAQQFSTMVKYWQLCYPVGGLIGSVSGSPLPDPEHPSGLYDKENYPEINSGVGIWAELGGNELPNSPHFTTNIGAEYGRDILDGSWRVTLRGDAYWQSQSWARVYNLDPYDKLHGWYNMNVSVKVENEDLGLEAEFYVKNLLDKSPITDSFLNSDDSALTTNVFVLDPRLVGFNVRKTF